MSTDGIIERNQTYEARRERPLEAACLIGDSSGGAIANLLMSRTAGPAVFICDMVLSGSLNVLAIRALTTSCPGYLPPVLNCKGIDRRMFGKLLVAGWRDMDYDSHMANTAYLRPGGRRAHDVFRGERLWRQPT